MHERVRAEEIQQHQLCAFQNDTFARQNRIKLVTSLRRRRERASLDLKHLHASLADICSMSKH